MNLLAYFLHVLAAIFWIGGIAYILVVLMPAVPQIALRDRARFLPIVLGRFLAVVWTSVAILLATGFYRILMVWDVTQDGFFQTAAGYVLITKLLLVAGLIGVAALVTARIVPNAKAHLSGHSHEPPDAYLCQQCRDIVGGMRQTLQIALGLALAIVLAAIQLRGV